MNSVIKRPWGSYEILLEEPYYKVKRLIINPGQSISLQRHQYRSEHWYIIEGAGIARLGDSNIPLNLSKHLDIPATYLHRATCISDQPLVMIEIQTGSYLGEDDIERLEDDYGRT